MKNRIRGWIIYRKDYKIQNPRVRPDAGILQYLLGVLRRLFVFCFLLFDHTQDICTEHDAA